MTSEPRTLLVFFEKVEKTPSGDLMRLSFAELDSWIAFARRIEERAGNTAGWLTGLRIEKSLREEKFPSKMEVDNEK